MAMKTASPWWFSALFAGGLLFLFLGERPFDHIESARLVMSGLGALLILGVTGLRLWTFSATSGDRRAVERVLLMSHLGVIVSLVLYVLSTQWGMGLIGQGDLEAKSAARLSIAQTVLWSIGMAVSLVPLFMVEMSLGTARRGSFEPKTLGKSDTDEAAVEWMRVREMGSSGLTIALAMSFLMVTCNVADQRNIRSDVSYYKTSSPGSATANVVKSVGQPLKVLLFFPKVNEVKNEVRGYFESLAAVTKNVEIEEHDRMISAALAKEHRVTLDGTVVLVYGDKSESIKLNPEPRKSRNLQTRTELRELDSKVNGALMKLVRARRTAYLTVGHGELGDPDSPWAKRGMKAEVIKQVLRDMNYQVKDLGLSQGLGNEVPDDASVVLVLGPQESLLDEEAAALERYLGRGGKVLIALDPQSNARLGKLEGRLGVTFNPTPITDDKEFLVQSRTIADRRLIATNRFSSHASITTLSRAPSRYGMIFLNAGSLDNAELAPEAKNAKRTFVVRSMTTAFADANNNFTFDGESEKRQQYNLVAAIEDDTVGQTGTQPKSPKNTAEEAKDPHGHDEHGHEEPKAAEDKSAEDVSTGGMRAMVFTDVELFSDLIQVQVPPANALFTDAVKWLGGEEHFAGEIVSEKDVVIQHTRNEDVLWFYSTIVGAPLLVMGVGLWFGRRRQNRSKRRAS